MTLLAVASTLNEPEPEFRSLENRVRSRTLCFFRRNHYGRWCIIGVNFSQKKKLCVTVFIITAEDLRTFLRWDKPKTLLESNVACLWESWFWLCFSKHCWEARREEEEKVVPFFYISIWYRWKKCDRQIFYLQYICVHLFYINKNVLN